MLDNNVVYSILIGIGLVGLLLFFYRSPKLNTGRGTPEIKKPGSASIQLQAYERLTLLVDRIAIPNLISRTSHEGLSARDMQLVLTRNIRDEFDYNITQQIYITPETWNAIKTLKEKNLLIINQVSAVLPPNATALDLNRAILEYIMNDSKADIHELVSEALSYEAKKLL